MIRLAPILCVWGLYGGLVFAEAPANLEAVKRESDPEKRSRLALLYAFELVNTSENAYAAGNKREGDNLLAELESAVELCHESLMASGKQARKHPKYFKKAEKDTRRLSRQLDNLRKTLNYDERDKLDAVTVRVNEINEALLLAIMTKPE